MTNKYEVALRKFEEVDDSHWQTWGTKTLSFLKESFEDTREALRAMKLVADGTHVIVPVEPTEAYMKQFDDTSGFRLVAKGFWYNMIKSYTHKEE